MILVNIRRKEGVLTEGKEGALTRLYDALEKELRKIFPKNGVEFDAPFFDKSARNVPDIRVEAEIAGHFEQNEVAIADQVRRAINALGIVSKDAEIEVVVRFSHVAVV